MSAIIDSTITKKKAPVTADQFDDADEEEDISFAAAAATRVSSEAAAPRNNSSPEKLTTTSTATTTAENLAATDIPKTTIPNMTPAPFITAPGAPAADSTRTHLAVASAYVGGAKPDPPDFPHAAASAEARRSASLMAPSTTAVEAVPTAVQRAKLAAAPAPRNPLDALALACGA